MDNNRNAFGFPVPLRPSRLSLWIAGVGCLTVAAILLCWMETQTPQPTPDVVTFGNRFEGNTFESLDEFKKDFHCIPLDGSNAGAVEYRCDKGIVLYEDKFNRDKFHTEGWMEVGK